MDARRFDRLTRTLTDRLGRRRLLGAAFVIAGSRVMGEAAAATCRPRGAGCTRDSQCCPGAGCFGGRTTSGRNARRTCSTCTCTSDADCDDFFGKVCRCSCVFATPVAAAPSAAFAALASAEGLAALGFDNDLVPEIGAHFTLRAEPRGAYSGVIEGQIVALDPVAGIEVMLQLAEMPEPALVRLAFSEREDGSSEIELARLTGSREACVMAAGLLGDGWADRLLNQRLSAIVRERALA